MNTLRVADDEVPQVVEYDAAEVEETEVNLVNLQEAAVSVQRIVVTRLLREHVGGAMELGHVDDTRKRTPEKMFRVPKLVEWVDKDPDVVVAELARGRLRCRVSASMGMGKSTRLATYVAKALDLRVLHVSLDAFSLQGVGVYMDAAGIGRFSRRWSSVRKASVSCMTYADFCSHMMTPRRSLLFKSFDVLLFDEAFVATWAVECAKRFFSAYAPPEISLLLASATIRADAGEVGSQLLGNFIEPSGVVSVDNAISSGKLVADYLVDRTMVVLPLVSEMYKLSAHYECNGVDVRVLDGADFYDDLSAVDAWLSGDSATPRVLIAHYSYAIGHNFPVSYVILSPYESELVFEDDCIVERTVAMTKEYVAQAKSRTGRGIVDGSGGVILSRERRDDVTMLESDKLRAFVTLCAGSIMPLNNDYWASAFRVFPDGLSVRVAQTLLKVCLPVEVTARYLASDGRVAKRYCAALNAFAHPDHFLLASDKELPVGHDTWLAESAFGASSVTLKVPFHAVGEVQIIMHALEMLSQSRIDVPRWRPTHEFAMGDGYDSEEESRNPRFKTARVQYRRIENPAPKPLPALPVVQAIPWVYKQEEAFEDVRAGGIIDAERCRAALRAIESNLRNYTVPNQEVFEVVETSEGSEAAVEYGDGAVESPGGSVVCTLPVRICERLNCGQSLRPEEMLVVVNKARSDVDRFVQSKLFDCLSGPWDSILHSLLDDSVVKWLIRRGMASDTYLVVDRMRGRFALELCSVISQSNVFKKTYLGIFSKLPSVDTVMKAIRAGRFDGIAQTDRYISRVQIVKENIDRVLLRAEEASVYLPTYITEAQRALPLRGAKVLGYVGSDMESMPESWRRHIRGDSSSSGISHGNRYVS